MWEWLVPAVLISVHDFCVLLLATYHSNSTADTDVKNTIFYNSFVFVIQHLLNCHSQFMVQNLGFIVVIIVV